MITKSFTDSEIRQTDCRGNASACFAVDCGADIIARAIKELSPLSDLWHRYGSIRYTDRWYDLHGTALLAEGRYGEAVKVLQKAYLHRNDHPAPLTISNPLSIKYIANPYYNGVDAEIAWHPDYKLNFARRMATLEQQKNNPYLTLQQRTEASLSYAIGMANSVYPCWSLTRHGLGETVFFPWLNPDTGAEKVTSRTLIHDFMTSGDCSISYNTFTNARSSMQRLRHKSLSLIDSALTEMPNRELAARYLVGMGRYKTVKHHYAETAAAEHLRSKCDSWDMW